MGLIYVVPAGVLWAVWLIAVALGAPWWLTFYVFGVACLATIAAVVLAILTVVGPRF